MPYSAVGMEKGELDTPALLLDMDRLERNIDKMAARCRECDVAWRPHTKGSKTPAIAHKLIAAGAIGITCAKLGEAEVMATAGIRDILIANQVVGKGKAARLASLQRQADVMVAVDDPHHIEEISAAAQTAGVNVRVLVEVNIGMERCGTAPGEPALELARKAEAAPGITFAGIMGYEGHTMLMPDDEKVPEVAKAIGLLTETAEHIRAAGLEVPIVSAGGTGTLAYTPTYPCMTEVQAGGGIMMCVVYDELMHARGFEHALTVLTTVVSRPAPDRAYVDAGRKASHHEFCLPRVVGREGITFSNLAAEHGYLALEGAETPLRVGEKIEFIPGYSDLTVCLYNTFHGIRNGRVEAVWDIQGRGKLE